MGYSSLSAQELQVSKRLSLLDTALEERNGLKRGVKEIYSKLLRLQARMKGQTGNALNPVLKDIQRLMHKYD
tara:strand:- start:376 stop:591 length:216 start_codon:yes stop_codon:yes gene_type:complete